MPKKIHFKDKYQYARYLAYGHLHDIPLSRDTKVYIAGKEHKVKHHTI